MDRIPCPDCHKLISQLAEACPHCGRKIQSGDVNRGIQQNSQNQKGCLIVLAIIVGLIVACVLISSLSKDKAVYRDGQIYIQEN